MPGQHYRETLAEFHLRFGAEPYSKLTHTERLAVVALRATLIAEETGELFEALGDLYVDQTKQNVEHLAKETADLLYVTVGASHLLGLPIVDSDPDADSHQYLASEMRFMSTVVLESASKDAQQALDDIFVLLDQEYPEEDISYALDDVAPTLQSLADGVVSFAAAHQIPLTEVFDAVHASNMSKLHPDTGKPILREDGKILKGPGYFEPDIGQVLSQAA